MSRAALFRLIAVALVVVAVTVIPLLIPAGPVRDFLAWVQGLGIWGLVFLALFYIPASILLVPGTLITLAGGALYGVWETTVAISLGSTAGACAAFLVGRGIARPWVERQVAASPKFQAIDRAIAEHGFRVVLLLRLSPVFPFNLLNYALSLTRVSFRDYFLASWIGMLPGTIMYVYIGSTLGELSAIFVRRERTVGEWIFFFVGLALTVLLTVYITHLARKALSRAIADASPSAQPAAGDTHA
jgi:uncharacterized membrane protein YdjX (TVP38/TMEM64 family)